MTVSHVAVCSHSCGAGVQHRTVACVTRGQEQEQELGKGARCGGRRRPKETRACRLQPCPARWLTSPWTPCSCARGEPGARSRQVVCRQGEEGGEACRGGARPHTSEQCSCVDQVSTARLGRQWHVTHIDND